MDPDDFSLTLGVDDEWQPLLASSSRGSAEESISIRKDGIKFSNAFVARARLHETGKQYVLMDCNNDRFLLRLRFMTMQEVDRARESFGPIDNVFKFHRDGGGTTLHRKTRGSVIQNSAALRRAPWLYSASDKLFGLRRRFPLVAHPTMPFTWTARIVPGFLHTAPLRIAKAEAQIGFYALATGDGECLYIGKGSISSRFNSHRGIVELRDAVAHWTSCKHDETATFAEAHYLHGLRAKNGKLPFWNKKGGRPMSDFDLA